MTGPTRSPARRDELTGPWFEGLRHGRLLVRACADGHLSRPDVLACDVCGRLDLDWAGCSGRGRVVSCAVDHGTRPPTRLVVVELDEGPWIFTRADEGEVVRGQAVRVRITRPDEGEPYPVIH